MAAAVWCAGWTAGQPLGWVARPFVPPAPYRPGRLYERELPGLLAVLEEVPRPWTAVIVDGYVWLDERATPGLGGHLSAAFGRQTPVVGVAKRVRRGAPALPVCRGRSLRPLWVSAAGVEMAWAAAQVGSMHGPFRLPTLLRLADAVARRGGLPPAPQGVPSGEASSRR